MFLRDRKVLNRIELNRENNCYIILKACKENFANDPTTRLMNPAKNELASISKVVLDQINVNIGEMLTLYQWNDLEAVIDWFRSIKEKHLHKFIIFYNNLFAPIVPNATFLYPLKTSEYLMVFFMFSGCRERVRWE